MGGKQSGARKPLLRAFIAAKRRGTDRQARLGSSRHLPENAGHYRSSGVESGGFWPMMQRFWDDGKFDICSNARDNRQAAGNHSRWRRQRAVGSA